jgi:hypothetical protein
MAIRLNDAVALTVVVGSAIALDNATLEICASKVAAIRRLLRSSISFVPFLYRLAVCVQQLAQDVLSKGSSDVSVVAGPLKAPNYQLNYLGVIIIGLWFPHNLYAHLVCKAHNIKRWLYKNGNIDW